MALHNKTREYSRNLLQSRLNDLVLELSQASHTMTPANRIMEITAEIATVSQCIADVLTHHLDEQPAAPASREQAAAAHLYRNVMQNAGTIRDMEVKLGLKGDEEFGKLHQLMHDMRVFCERESAKSQAETSMRGHTREKASNGNLPGLPSGNSPLTAQQ